MPPVLKASGNIKIIGKTKHCRHQAVFSAEQLIISSQRFQMWVSFNNRVKNSAFHPPSNDDGQAHCQQTLYRRDVPSIFKKIDPQCGKRVVTMSSNSLTLSKSAHANDAISWASASQLTPTMLHVWQSITLPQ